MPAAAAVRLRSAAGVMATPIERAAPREPQEGTGARHVEAEFPPRGPAVSPGMGRRDIAEAEIAEADLPKTITSRPGRAGAWVRLGRPTEHPSCCLRAQPLTSRQRRRPRGHTIANRYECGGERGRDRHRYAAATARRDSSSRFKRVSRRPATSRTNTVWFTKRRARSPTWTTRTSCGRTTSSVRDGARSCEEPCRERRCTTSPGVWFPVIGRWDQIRAASRLRTPAADPGTEPSNGSGGETRDDPPRARARFRPGWLGWMLGSG